MAKDMKEKAQEITQQASGNPSSDQGEEKRGGKGKKTFKEYLGEALQWIAIFLGWRQFQQPGGAGGQSTQAAQKEIPTWALPIVHALTLADEIKKTVTAILASTSVDDAFKFFDFVDWATNRGYNLVRFRLMIAGMQKENKEALLTFIKWIIQLDGNIEKQEKLAKQGEFLVKLSLHQKLLRWGFNNKLLANILFLPMLFFIIADLIIIALFTLSLTVATLIFIFQNLA